MALSNADRQRRYRERLKAAASGDGGPTLLALLTAYFEERPERLGDYSLEEQSPAAAAAILLEDMIKPQVEDMQDVLQEENSPAAVALRALLTRIAEGWVRPSNRKRR